MSQQYLFRLPHSARKSVTRPLFVVLHWLTYPDWADNWTRCTNPVDAVFKDLRPVPASYHWIHHNGTPYEIVPWKVTAWHAGGSEGIKDANEHTIGLAFATPSPSQNPRGIEGEVQAPFYWRAKGRTENWWYPPVPSPQAVDAAVDYILRCRREGAQIAGVYGHHQIKTQKNDIKNMDPQFAVNTVTIEQVRDRMMAPMEPGGQV